MNTFITRYFGLNAYHDQPTRRELARAFYNVALLVGVVLTAILILTLTQPGGFQITRIELIGSLLGASLLVTIITPFINRAGYVEVAGGLITAVLITTTSAIYFENGFADESAGIQLAIAILLGGFFNHVRGALLATLATTGALAASLITTETPIVASTFMQFIGLWLVGASVILLLRYAIIARQEGQSAAVNQQIKLAEITNDIARIASSRAALEEVLDRMTDMVLDRFPEIYHAQVFLVDDRGATAKLASSTGEVGDKLLARAHSLAVGSLSVIGQATLGGAPIIARAGEKDGIHRPNELLPDTTLEAAFPMRVENNVIGALDLQSKTLTGLTESQIVAFESLADNLALVIDNVRQYNYVQEQRLENQRLAEQTRQSAREVERLNQRLIGRAWSEYLSNQGDQISLAMDFNTREVEHNIDWTPSLKAAVDNDHVIQDTGVITVPLRVRGQVIGAMEFELDDMDSFSPEDLELIQEISNRFGLAAENTRLLTQSQLTAQREALINEIGARLQSSNNIEGTLAEAARSLYETLKVDKVHIRLGSPTATPTATNGKGNDA